MEESDVFKINDDYDDDDDVTTSSTTNIIPDTFVKISIRRAILKSIHV